MENIKGAIITSNYNNEVFLEDCIKSALMQEAPFPIYVILSDDGSTDHSVDICERYHRNSPDRIINLSSVENRGFVANYFRCIKYALTFGVTHLLLLDSDDFLCHKDYFAKQVDFLSAHPTYSLSFPL